MRKQCQFMLWSVMLIGTVCQGAELKVYKLVAVVQIPANTDRATSHLTVAPSSSPIQIVGVTTEAFALPQYVPVTSIQTELDLVEKNRRLIVRTIDNGAVEVWAPAPMEVTCIRPPNIKGVVIWAVVVVTVKYD